MTGTPIIAKPMLYSGPMVRALLREIKTPGSGKTQTRRIVKPQPTHRLIEGLGHITVGMDPALDGAVWYDGDCIGPGREVRPRCRVGDVLYVREAVWIFHDYDDESRDCGPNVDCGYDYVATPNCETPPVCEEEQTILPYTGKAEPGFWWPDTPHGWDGKDIDTIQQRRGVWTFLVHRPATKRPSMFMPRQCCRITLDVTGVRAERVESISAADAIAEGFDSRDDFLRLFYDVNKRAAKGSNPWVWAYTFTPMEVQP